MPRRKVREQSFSVGLFILLALVILVTGILWIRNFMVRPSYTFIVEYQDPWHISPGVAVYYRGVQIGRVTRVELAPDQESTYFYIGVSRGDIVLPENADIHIRFEGITGVRFLQIDPPEVAVGVISDGEIVRGVEDNALEKLQDQLARLAEDRALERLVNNSIEAMDALAQASQEFEVFSRDARQVLQVNATPIRLAVNQFTRTMRSFELAGGEILAISTRTEERLANVIPRITASIEQFNQNTQNADEAIEAVELAASQVARTFGTVSTQLNRTNLIPQLSQTLTQLSGGIQTVQGVFEQISPGVTEIQGTLGSLAQAGETLQQTLAPLAAGSGSLQQLAQPLQQLSRLGVEIQTTIDEIQPLLGVTQQPEALQAQLSRLRVLSSNITQTVETVSPQLEKAQAAQPVSSVEAIIRAVQDLGRVSQTISQLVRQIEPQLESAVAALGAPPADKAAVWPRPGLLGSLHQTIDNVGQAAQRVDCVAAQLSHILGERFLLFKLMFGKPGAGYEQCQEPCPDPTYYRAKPALTNITVTGSRPAVLTKPQSPSQQCLP